MGDIRYEYMFSLMGGCKPKTGLSLYIDPDRYYSVAELRCDVSSLIRNAGFESIAERFRLAVEDIDNIYGLLIVAASYVNIERTVDEVGEESRVPLDNVGWIAKDGKVVWSYNGMAFASKEDAIEYRQRDKDALARQRHK